MGRGQKSLLLIVLTLLLIVKPVAAITAPYQIRSVLFRVMDFWSDAVDDPDFDPTAPTRNLPASPTVPPVPTIVPGACPFQAIAYVRECTDYNCTQTVPISLFDNNQQYGIANNLQILKKGDVPDPNIPFAHQGRPGEAVYLNGSQKFPTTDGYNQQDPADVKVYLDANRDSVVDGDYEIVKKECESFGSNAGCPHGQQKYSSAEGPLDTMPALLVDCNVNIRYGWLLRKPGLKPPTPTLSGPRTPSSSPTSPSGPTQKQPTVSQSGPTQSPQNKDTQIQNLISHISEQNVRRHLEDLVDDDATPEKDERQSRYSGTPGNQAEAAAVKSYFESLGLQAEFQPFSLSTRSGLVQTQNIIGKLIGKKTNEVYLITAHLDTTSEAVPSGPAPGADDNGSGVAAVMEAAAAFKKSGIQPSYTIEFILFSGEEQRLLGSTHYVQNLPSVKVIKGVFNLDMIGYNPSGTCVKFGYKNYNGDNILSEAVVKANTDFNIGLNVHSVASDIDRSDHAPFWRAGKPAVFGYECNVFSNPRYHKTTDTLDYLNFDQITKTAKAVTAAVARYALE